MKKNNLILTILLLTVILFISSCGGTDTKTEDGSTTSKSVDEGEVTIGNQVWTSNNLDVEKYRNGDAIPQVQDANAWSNLTTGAWCYYDNDASNGTKYGKLYNWYAVNDPRGLAPKGYHVPTDSEWTTLTTYLGGESEAGTKMKSSSGWKNSGNNSSSFNGLPGGFRVGGGIFYYLGVDGSLWSSSENNTETAWYRGLVSKGSSIDRYPDFKPAGLSVRCLRDSSAP